MSDFDASWVERVCELCDPIFAAAGVGFARQVQYADREQPVVSALLWEADPALFVAAYSDSGVVESYGAQQWPSVTCIDFWAYVDHENRWCRLSVEGWNLPELLVPLTGRTTLDGCALADTFARILGVRSPRT